MRDLEEKQQHCADKLWRERSCAKTARQAWRWTSSPKSLVRRRIPPKKSCVHGAYTEDRARWGDELKITWANIYDDPEDEEAQERRIRKLREEGKKGRSRKKRRAQERRGGSGNSGKKGRSRKKGKERVKTSQRKWFSEPVGGWLWRLFLVGVMSDATRAGVLE